MSEPTELKPCPFCGSTDVKFGGDDKIVGSWCQTCGAQGPNGYQHDVDWNHRPTETAAKAEGVREGVEMAAKHADSKAKDIADWNAVARLKNMPHEIRNLLREGESETDQASSSKAR